MFKHVQSNNEQKLSSPAKWRCVEAVYLDGFIELLHDSAVYESAVLVVVDEGAGVHLHLALLQQQLHLQVQVIARTVLT